MYWDLTIRRFLIKKLILTVILLIVLGTSWVLFRENRNEQVGNISQKVPASLTLNTNNTNSTSEVHIEVPPEAQTVDANKTVNVSGVDNIIPEKNIDTEDVLTDKDYDWRDDAANTPASVKKQDPWSLKKGPIGSTYNADLNVLIKQFGDTLEVRAAYAYLKKIVGGKDRTIEEEISGLEALKALYPELHTQEQESFLQVLKETHAVGGTLNPISEAEYKELQNR